MLALHGFGLLVVGLLLQALLLDDTLVGGLFLALLLLDGFALQPLVALLALHLLIAALLLAPVMHRLIHDHALDRRGRDLDVRAGPMERERERRKEREVQRDGEKGRSAVLAQHRDHRRGRRPRRFFEALRIRQEADLRRAGLLEQRRPDHDTTVRHVLVTLHEHRRIRVAAQHRRHALEHDRVLDRRPRACRRCSRRSDPPCRC